MYNKMLIIAFIILMSGVCLANHPVLVEGESDFDGDGLLGTDEDLDGDRVFGTLTTALAADFGAINNNGTITIVTSGRFPESLLITGANGNVSIEAASGVEASIDAVLAGVAGNVARQNDPGIEINAPSDRRITLRNLTIRNWRNGISVSGDSHVIIDNCRVEHSLNFGIHVMGNAKVAIIDSRVSGTGFRVGAAGNSPSVDLPMPGVGIQFENGTSGSISESSSIGNFGKGLIKARGKSKKVDLIDFDNGL